MAGIEIVAVVVGFILAAIGLVRGPSKELGVTMALVVMMAVLTQFDALVDFNEMPGKVNNALQAVGLDSDSVLQQRTTVWYLYTAATIFTAFLAYHGHETLAFGFKDPPGVGGAILGWLAGALNGYLIFGTIWYYLWRLDYPIQQYVWFEARFTELAQNLVNLLPQNLLSGVVLSGLALALLWWKILR
jgi:uncharacterized membrane protein required for colicin V production